MAARRLHHEAWQNDTGRAVQAQAGVTVAAAELQSKLEGKNLKIVLNFNFRLCNSNPVLRSMEILKCTTDSLLFLLKYKGLHIWILES